MVEKTVYLSLGSNMGNREEYLGQALYALERDGVTLTKRSSVYETEPQDVKQQPWFLNMAVEGRTQAMPLELLKLVLRIEREIGRVRQPNAKGGPRPIDIDVLLFGSSVVNKPPQLLVPHPRMLERRFVLDPLLEIAPDLLHPVTRQALRTYLPATLNQQVRIKR